MRICFASSGKHWGGGERLLATLIAGIAEAKEEVALVTREHSPLAEWGNQQPYMPVLELPGHGKSPRSLWRMRQWLLANEVDLLVLNDPHAIVSGGVAALRLPIPKIGIRHTVFPINSAWKHNKLLDEIICVSNAAADQCRSGGIPQAKLAVIHGAVPPLKIDAAHVQRTRKQFRLAGTSSNEQNILAIGSLLPVKGFDTLIRAISRGVQRGRPWRLWIAGEGPERGALWNVARELEVTDRVHLMGTRDDIGELLVAADCFVSASHSEGLSLVLIEAMLAGCPIASTAVGGSRELLDVNQDNRSPLAATFQSGDVHGLVAAMDDALQGTSAIADRCELARQWAEEQFTVERMVDGHLACYRKLLGCEPVESGPPQRSAA